MGSYTKSNEVVLLLDNYLTDSQNLHLSFKNAGKDYPAVVIEEDGFLPEGVISVFGYFLGDFSKADNIPGKPRYFNQITVPEYWEISGNNSSGKVHDLNKERARIFYAEPKHKRLVKVVDWMDEKGVVRSSDHYNRYGALYARTIFNAKAQKVNKTYFSATGQEIIMENYVTGDIILNDDKQVLIFKNKTDFILYFMKKAGYEERRIYFNSLSTPFFVSQRLSSNDKGDVLFWQEPIRGEIPGNMKIILDGQSTCTGNIKVQKRNAYDKMMELGVSPQIAQRLGFVYSFKKENAHSREALICTNSDRIEQLNKLVAELPEIHFHVAALTEMSSKLMSMGVHENVTLYPGVKRAVLDELFEKCDLYFDINHESEIVSAVQNAFLHNHLIFAFSETIHNRDYVAEEHIYASNDANRMISDLKAVLMDDNLLESHLEIQRASALAENKEAYKEL